VLAPVGVGSKVDWPEWPVGARGGVGAGLLGVLQEVRVFEEEEEEEETETEEKRQEVTVDMGCSIRSAAGWMQGP
jgi:hypothetical protein